MNHWQIGVNKYKYSRYGKNSAQCLKTDLIYEVEGHGSLACPHFSRFEVPEVLATDVVHARLQFPSNLVFLPILLPLHSSNKEKMTDDRRVKTISFDNL